LRARTWHGFKKGSGTVAETAEGGCALRCLTPFRTMRLKLVVALSFDMIQPPATSSNGTAQRFCKRSNGCSGYADRKDETERRSKAESADNANDLDCFSGELQRFLRKLLNFKPISQCKIATNC
jgi:hypothetical protein